jgi:16S rRNA (uracil1498-N3)-methyltransferase
VTRRFYTGSGSLDNDAVRLGPDLAARLSRVLRLRRGDEIVLFDGEGAEARARLDTLDERAAMATVLQRLEPRPEPRLRVHLYAAIAKGDRFDWLVEKATEIGACRVVPLICARSVVKTGEGPRLDRWRRIAVEAAEQCGRSFVPDVDAPQSFARALVDAPGIKLLPYESADERTPNIQHALDEQVDALFALREVSVFVGPEGGFDDGEVAAAGDAGAVIVTLGRRILRSETAAIVALTLVLHAAAELG